MPMIAHPAWQLAPRISLADLTTVRRWKFVPARRGDEAVAASVLVPIVFSLKD